MASPEANGNGHIGLEQDVVGRASDSNTDLPKYAGASCLSSHYPLRTRYKLSCPRCRYAVTPAFQDDNHRDAAVDQEDLDDDDDFADSLPSFGRSPDVDMPANGHLQQLLMPQGKLEGRPMQPS